MKLIVFYVSFCLYNCCLVNTSASLQTAMSISDEDRALQSIYKKIDTNLKHLIDRSYKTILPHLLEASEAMNLSTPCLANMLSIGLGTRNLKMWAFNFLDATGKVNEGFLYGNFAMLGNFDQCLAAVSKNKKGEVQFRGKYCLISYNTFLPTVQNADAPRRTYDNTRNLSEAVQFAIRYSQKLVYLHGFLYGLCIPSGCSLKDVQNMVNYVGDVVFMNFTAEHCQVESEATYLTTRKVIIICIFALFLLAGTSSSLLEYYHKSRNIEVKDVAATVFQSFSITSNFSRLISTKTDEEMFSCLNGIRVLNIFYIIYGHRLSAMIEFPLQRNAVLNIENYCDTFFYQIVLNTQITVDVFFFMSAFLNMYTRMKLAKNGVKPSWWRIVIHRLWRIYPGYIAILLLLQLFTPRSPLGPYFAEQFNCDKEWWKNLLFINNFYPKNKCLTHTWYIACDFQLFLMSLFIIPLIINKPKIGNLMNATIITAGITATVIWIYTKKIPPSVYDHKADEPSRVEEIIEVYMQSTTHISTYFLGILMGYILSAKKDIQITKVYQLIGWITASLTFMFMLFITLRWNSGTAYTPAESALYFAFSKPLYAAAVGWMIFCCVTGHGGIINYILSLKLWIPLSRLTYTIYLVSLVLQFFFYASLRTTIDTHWMLTIWLYLGDIVVSCLIALVVGVVVEKPIFALEKFVFQSKNTEDRNLQHTTVSMVKFEESKNEVIAENLNGTSFSSEKNCDYPAVPSNGTLLTHDKQYRNDVDAANLKNSQLSVGNN